MRKREKIGSGAFATVHRYVDEDSGAEKAVKIIDCFKNIVPIDTIRKEVKILERLSHDYIVKFEGFQKLNDSVFIIMEYAKGGTIKSLIKIIGALLEKKVSKYSRQILEGLAYLHNRGIVHRDLKCENILLDDSDNCKLSDFGISKEDKDIHSRSGCDTDCGTVYWRSPESLQGKHGWKTDIWSFGCTVLEMLNTEPPYRHLSVYKAMTKIVNEGIVPSFPPNTSSHCVLFTKMCIKKNPKSRPSAKELCQQKFIQMSSES